MDEWNCIVKIDVRVWDKQQLFAAALHHAVHVDNMTSESAMEFLVEDGEINVHGCLVMLLDPGSLPGVDFNSTEVEGY